MKEIKQLKLQEQLAFYYHEAPMQRRKLVDLYKKVQDNLLMIGFAGHFSAGKSSLINTLMGDAILPTSPIPTSANLVKIQKGEENIVRIYSGDGEAIEFQGEYEHARIQELAKEGSTIHSIELVQSDTPLPEGVALLDTPGVDSSNDADQVITESSLHMMDTVVYVMDYNHVQSEVNLGFLRKLSEQGKELAIVINQIDKHKEEEITFSRFRRSVKESLKDWGITINRIFYISLKDKDHPHNELRTLQQWVEGQMSQQSSSTVEKTVQHALTHLIEEELRSYEATYQDELERIEYDLSKSHDEDREDELDQEWKRLEAEPQQSQQEVKEKLQRTLSNAYVMSHDIRELAKAFLEAEQPDFKVGLLFSKAKTREAREKRSQEFYSSLMKKVEANLQWPLQNVLVETAREYGVVGDEALQRLQSIEADYPIERLRTSIKSGALVNGSYVLQYSEDVLEDLRAVFRNQALNEWKRIETIIEERNESKKNDLFSSMERLNKRNEWKDRRDEILRSLEDKKQRLSDSSAVTSEATQALQAALNEREAKVDIRSWDTMTDTISDETKDAHDVETKERTEEVDVQQTINALTELERLLSDEPNFQEFVEEMRAKRSTIEERSYTVALFGAFSAGKSSFANALLEEGVLPVSPNPTTATINKICPPTENRPHRTVRVKFKSPRELFDDLLQALPALGNEPDSLPALVKFVSNRMSELEQQLEQKRYSFIRAVVAGFESSSSALGSVTTIPYEDFSSYVSTEERSCFVEWVELYVDCSFTRRGITLVDTPGADSVNARHTEVSFQYMKEADAILFVTYYNHAFSRADREFLIQLGRVKDAFSMDKMFFLLNAVDLAKDDEERSLVTGYLRDQLQSYGIRLPRIYGVSSRDGMDDKRRVHSGIPEFEKNFYQFIEHELAYVLVHSANHLMKRVRSTLEDYVQAVSLNQEERQDYQQQLQEEKLERIDLTQMSAIERYESALQQKIEKQLFYVKQRVLLRLHDFIKEEFHPGAITDNGKGGREQLRESMERVMELMQNDMMQEMRVVSLRMERFLLEKGEEWLEDFGEALREHGRSLTLPELPDHTCSSIDVSTPFEQLNVGDFEEALQLFKSTKAFFEGKGRDKMRDVVERVYDEWASTYINEELAHVYNHFAREWRTLIEETKGNVVQSIQLYYDGLIEALKDEGSYEHWSQLLNDVRHNV
ncbi:hypothetical protein N781_02855 [Pontibacillus halophilus JSM 076056 = DSM 19796]|uniref:Dynamin N-terminal domain-containing protein n=1 Tax=Pontibacillus halophilus JSM 076056 = DSM 19796 TaxID=1385510 RepID=A0A0A5GFR0_9BACI|nr:dynamin family protein [Pontibacillus halophilus]KGX92071.1 hypothetical protein N781_02855 [Pontibacillus halophilus JSM 076056 = DSM 19796]